MDKHIQQSDTAQDKIVLEASFSCHIGDVRQINEDRVLAKKYQVKDEEWGLFLVADGMGGMSRGSEASQTIVDVLSDWWDNTLKAMLSNTFDQSAIVESLDNAINQANSIVLAIQAEKMIGSTLSLILVMGQQYVIRHVGDSRIYLLNKAIGIKQLTSDHSFVAEQIEAGILTQEEAKIHPKRNVITRCIGMKEMPEMYEATGKCEAGDLFLLCSDGFYHMVSEEDMLNTTFDTQLPDMEKKLRAMLKLVKKAGKAHDNVTVVLVYLTDADETEVMK